MEKNLFVYLLFLFIFSFGCRESIENQQEEKEDPIEEEIVEHDRVEHAFVLRFLAGIEEDKDAKAVILGRWQEIACGFDETMSSTPSGFIYEFSDDNQLMGKYNNGFNDQVFLYYIDSEYVYMKPMDTDEDVYHYSNIFVYKYSFDDELTLTRVFGLIPAKPYYPKIFKFKRIM